jgi:hypothetical protein
MKAQGEKSSIKGFEQPFIKYVAKEIIEESHCKLSKSQNMGEQHVAGDVTNLNHQT